MTMLDRMRRHKGWLKWSLAMVVLAFIVFYIPSFLSDTTTAGVGVGAAPTEVIAEVDGRIVTAGQFLQRYNAQMQSYRAAYGSSLNDQILRQLGIDQQILQQMIDEQAAIVAEIGRQHLRKLAENRFQQTRETRIVALNARFRRDNSLKCNGNPD